MQEDIGLVLKSCALSSSNEERTSNEAKIRQYKQEDPQKFVYEMAQQLNNYALDPAARQLAGVLLKNTIREGDDVPFWFSFSTEANLKLKELILAPLADENKSVRLSACSCVATVACLELPQNLWPDIITNLCSNAAHDQLHIKESSLKTLGYICEELESNILNEDNTNLVISALVEALESSKDNEELMKIAVEAVLHSLVFAEKIFEEKKGDIIIERILDNALNPSSDVRTTVMMCIAEIVRLYYDHVHNFMEKITEVTFQIMKEDVEEVGTMAVEVWCSFCEEEIFLKKRKKQCNDYVFKVFSPLLDIILLLLNDSELDEDEDSDSWNKSTAAG
jgi:importin subunit beta-1